MSLINNLKLPLLLTTDESSNIDSSNYIELESKDIDEAYSNENDIAISFPSVSTNRLLTVRKAKPKAYVSSASIEAQREFLPNQDSMSDNDDLDDVYATKKMIPYRRNPIMLVLFIIFSILSLGGLILICRWIPGLQLILTALPCKIKNATHILILGKYSGMRTTCKIKDITLEYKDPNGENIEVQHFRILEYRKAIYIFDREKSIFRKSEFTMNYPFSYIHNELGKGVDESTRLKRRTFFGKNSIQIESPNIIAILIDEILNPFYFFQVLCIVVWAIDQYYYYAVAIAFMAVASAFLALYETKRNRNKLRDMTKFKCNVVRFIGSNKQIVESSELVPGDVIEIPDGTAPCDIILLSGQCIVNESMLTGESIPVLKSEISSSSNDVYNYSTHKNHIVFGGTYVIQKRKQGKDKVYGIVCKSGYSTSKGALILSILYPKPNKFRFYTDALKFVCILFLFAIVCFIISTIQLYRLGVAFNEIILRAMDLITISVPPSLPIAMTVGTTIALNRLKRFKVFCISPPRINVSGQINLMCFDKTGTLTEDGLDLEGVRPGTQEGFSQMIKGNSLYETLTNGTDLDKILLQALATCQSLTYVNNLLVGDPLEVKIFEATKYSLIENETEVEGVPSTIVRPPYLSEIYNLDQNDSMKVEEIAILRRFDFRSSLQRMSVIVKNMKSSKTISFVKGSPEMIQNLCLKDTVPEKFSDTLYNYANKGFRVLACGYKILDNVDLTNADKVQRDDVESEIIFLGLIIMSNQLKQVTPRVISTLNKSMIRSVMVTGDNPYTAISVAKQCGILPPDSSVYLGQLSNEDIKNPVIWRNADTNSILDFYDSSINLDTVNLAVVGDVFDYIIKFQDKPTLNWILTRSNIFSRMTPAQKMKLVELFQNNRISVGMCGDGANDCAALKTANIGISLSSSEASIAAPFTCTQPDISCVPTVIKEGKAALSTSFSMFKFIALYSLIQSLTVIILYTMNTNLSDWQFLFVDLGLIFPIVWLIGTTYARYRLVKETPESTLISLRVFSSLLFHLFFAFSIMLFVWIQLGKESWYVPLNPKPENKENLQCTETTVMFPLSTFLTLSIGISLSITKPFKRNITSNWMYTLCLIVLLSVVSYIMLIPDSKTMNLFLFVELPTQYRLKLWFIALLHLAFAYLFEKLIIVGLLGYPSSNRQYQIGKFKQLLNI